jgi:hypothetical protein
MSPEAPQTPSYIASKHWGRICAIGHVETHAMTKYGHKIEVKKSWLRLARTGRLNHSTLGVSFEKKGYVSSFSKTADVGWVVQHPVSWTKNIAQHLTCYILVKIKLSSGVIKIAGRDIRAYSVTVITYIYVIFLEVLSTFLYLIV